MALNGSQLSVEAMLLGDSLVPAFCLGALYLVVRYLEQDRGAHAVPFWVWLVPGLLLGLAVLAKGTVLLAAAALCVTVALRGLRARRWRSATSGAIMCAGVCLVLAAPILRNGLMYGRWTVALNGPVTLYIGNVPGATGVSVYPPDFEQTIKRFQKTGAPASAWLDKLQEELRAHPGALRAVLLRKTLLVLNSWDAPDNGNYYFVRRYVLPLRAFTFGPLFLYVIGFLGIGLTVRRWRELAPLYAFAAFLGVGLILVLVAGRYKLPFLALLAVFGGGAASVLAQHLRARHYGVVAASALAAAALACVFWPRGPIGVPRSWSELRPKEFLNNAMLLAAEGREDEARHILEEGLAVFQDDPWFAEPLAGLYLKAGQPERAVAVTEAALAHGVVTQHILERRLLAYRALSLTDKARAAAGELAARYPESALLNSAEPGNPSAPGRR
jgi:MFS family permease